MVSETGEKVGNQIYNYTASPASSEVISIKFLHNEFRNDAIFLIEK